MQIVKQHMRTLLHKIIFLWYTLHKVNFIYFMTDWMSLGKCIILDNHRHNQERWYCFHLPEFALGFLWYTIYHYFFSFSGITYRWAHTMCHLLCMATLTQCNVFETLLCPCMCQKSKLFFYFNSLVVIYYIKISPVVSPISNWWRFW